MSTKSPVTWLAVLLALLLAAPLYAQARTVYVGDLPLNLRAGPGLSFAAQAELAPGEALTVVGESGAWLNVRRADGQTGWVHGEYVSSTPPASPPPAPSPAVVEVITGRLNLRSGPGLSFSVVAELPQGEKLNLLARSGAWLNLQRANGQTGWANSLYVKETTGPISVSPTAAPAPTTAAPAPAPTTSSPTTYAIVNAAFLNLRSGPGLSFPSVAELPKGEALTVIGKSSGWLNLLRSNGQQGWANAFYMQLTDVPPTSAPAPGAAASAAAVTTLTGSALCRPGDVLFGVQNPSRLKVLNSCLTVTGTVVESSRSEDGDLTFRLQVDPAYAWALNSANRSLLRGYLQVEIVPADQLAVAAPAIGSRVSVTGAYVLDIPYGWNEIHPAWLVVPAQ